MASRIIHVCISQKICKDLNIEDTNRFFLGSLLPDIPSINKLPKDVSHFETKLEGKDYKTIDFQAFFNKYKEFMKDPIFLGYWTHLISDEIWLKDIYIPYIKEKTSGFSKKSINKLYYADYEISNKTLIRNFQLEKDCITPINDFKIDEITTNLSTIKSLVKKFQRPFKHLDEGQKNMNLLTETYIDNYIINTSTICINLLKEQLNL